MKNLHPPQTALFISQIASAAAQMARQRFTHRAHTRQFFTENRFDFFAQIGGVQIHTPDMRVGKNRLQLPAIGIEYSLPRSSTFSR